MPAKCLLAGNAKCVGFAAIHQGLNGGFHRAYPVVIAALQALDFRCEVADTALASPLARTRPQMARGTVISFMENLPLRGEAWAIAILEKTVYPSKTTGGGETWEMTRIRPEKEATLREVLAEVSLLDIGRLLKNTSLTLGCLGIFYAIIFGAGAVASNVTGIGTDDLGIPHWVIWMALAWGYIFAACNERSFHEWNASWYFPRLGWLSSLLLAAYLVGFVYFNIPIFNMELGAERAFAAVALWLGYTGPFLLFLSATNVGHTKLMEKRAEAEANE